MFSHDIKAKRLHPYTSPQYKALLIIPHKWRCRHLTDGGEVKIKL